MNPEWVQRYYGAIFTCVERYREMASRNTGRCVACDHIEADHVDVPRHEQTPPTACMRGTGNGGVCDCDAYVAGMGDLLHFLAEFTREVPIVKLSRWLGYVQGVLVARGVTTVKAERDWTRPLFRPLDFAEKE